VIQVFHSLFENQCKSVGSEKCDNARKNIARGPTQMNTESVRVSVDPRAKNGDRIHK